MAEHRDIPTGGAPQDGDDEAGKLVTGPNNDPLEVEEREQDQLASEADDLSTDLQETADEAEEAPPSDESEGEASGAIPNSPKTPPAPPPSQATASLPPLPPTPTQAIDDLSVDTPDFGDEAIEEAPAPGEEELNAVQDALQAFGEQVDKFNEAGGADGGGGGDQGPDSALSDPEGPLAEFSDSVASFGHASYEFLRDHSRTLNDLVRQLETERL